MTVPLCSVESLKLIKVSSSYPLFLSALFVVVSPMLTVTGFLTVEIMLLLTGFGATAFLYSYFLQKKEGVKAFLIWFIMVVIGLIIGLYRPDDVNYPLVLHSNNLHDNGLPFSLFLNTAKTLAGYIAIVFLITLPIVGAPLLRSSRAKIAAIIVLPVCVMSIAYFVLDLHFHFKELNYIAIFGVVNLLTTCVSEEAFMRLIFQQEMGRCINRYSNKKILVEGLPIALTSLLFTATHIGPSLEVTLIYSLAGFSYGLLYVLTKNMWYCIACHFLVNIFHFAFFTYPLF